MPITYTTGNYDAARDDIPVKQATLPMTRGAAPKTVAWPANSSPGGGGGGSTTNPTTGQLWPR